MNSKNLSRHNRFFEKFLLTKVRWSHAYALVSHLRRNLARVGLIGLRCPAGGTYENNISFQKSACVYDWYSFEWHDIVRYATSLSLPPNRLVCLGALLFLRHCNAFYLLNEKRILECALAVYYWRPIIFHTMLRRSSDASQSRISRPLKLDFDARQSDGRNVKFC